MEISDIISEVRVYGLEESFRGSKFPKAVDVSKCTPTFTPTIGKLGACEVGSGHDNFLNGIIVQFDLTFTNKAWVEAERYHFLDFVSSQSTMHRITQFDLSKAYIGYVDGRIIDIMMDKVAEYNEHPTPEKYLEILYSNPSGLRLTARMTTDYRELKNIYYQRRNHKLPEWRVFCKWVETLPYMDKFLSIESKEEED